MPRGGKREGAGKPRKRFVIVLDKERVQFVRLLAAKYGVTEEQIICLALDKMVPELFK